MNIDMDDPRLTAYVLGELSARERAVVEKAMAASAELRRVVDQIRATTELLSKGLADPPSLAFTAEQRSMLESAYLSMATTSPGADVRHLPPDENQHEVWAFAHRITRRWWVPTSIAASFVVMVVGAGLGFNLSQSGDSLSDRQLAENGNSAATPEHSNNTEPRALARAKERSTLVDQAQGLSEYPDSSDANGQDGDLYDYDRFVAADSNRNLVGSWDIMASGGIVDGKLRRPPPIVKGVPSEQATRDELLFGLPMVHGAFDSMDLDPQASIAHQAPSGPNYTLQRFRVGDRIADAVGSNRSGDPLDHQFYAGGKVTFLHSMETFPTNGNASFEIAPGNTVHGPRRRIASARSTRAGADEVSRLLNGRESKTSGVRLYGYSQSASNFARVDAEQLGYLVQLRKSLDDQGTYLVDGNFDAGEIYIPYNPYGRERFSPIAENPFKLSEFEPLSTFAIDVDTAGYSLVRQSLDANALPPAPSVRVEELINYFAYEYPLPTGDNPFSVIVDITDCPWRSEHLLARIGLKGQEYEIEDQPLANLVFLIDTSGSMNQIKKLSLVKESLRLLIDEMTEDDTIAIVTYADEASLALPATPCSKSAGIIDAIDTLVAGGSTNGEDGIHQAYDIALDNYIEDGINRVILATDGDFNVGASETKALKELIADRASDGVFLTVLGFGRGSYSDAKLEALSDTGNGSYHYIDSIDEAHKVLVDQIGGTLMTIAKDVKIQVEFNPNQVVAYRMLGYENRKLAARDFNDDKKDAGEIGAGHSVTVFYEFIPVDTESDRDFDLLDTLEETAVPAAESNDAVKETLEDEAVVFDTAVPDADSFDAEPNEDVVADDPVVSEEWAVDDVPASADLGVDPLRYQLADADVEALDETGAVAVDGLGTFEAETMLVRIRYKEPDGDASKLIELPVVDQGLSIEDASDDYRFAAAVASFGMLLRGSPHSGDFTFESVIELAESCLGNDPAGDREEFLYLVEKAMELTGE